MRDTSHILTQAEWTKLAEVYIETQSATAAAKAVGIGPSTAARYINDGVGAYRAIKPMMEEAQQSVANLTVDENVKLMKAHMSANIRMTQLSVKALNDIEFKPDGEELANGKTQVNERTLRTMATIFERLFVCNRELRADAQGAPSPNAQTINIGVQTTVSMQAPSEIQQRALNAMKEHAEVHATYQGTSSEPALVAAAIEAAGLRARITDGQSSDGSDDGRDASDSGGATERREDSGNGRDASSE